MPFNKYSEKQKKLARVAEPRDAITGADFKALKKGNKMKKYEYGKEVKKYKNGKEVIKDVAKTAARSAYKAKTAPLQAASMLANKIAPGSKVAKSLGKAAAPFKRGGEVCTGLANRRRKTQEGKY